jgi:ArpU family phage transcriptional regulator
MHKIHSFQKEEIEMMMQLDLMLPKLDERATRQAVKEAFKIYHEYRKSLQVAESYTTNGGIGWKFLSGISGRPQDSKTAFYPLNDADAIRGSSKRLPAAQELTKVVERLQQYQERLDAMRDFCELMERVVENLPEEEREIMKRTLLVERKKRQKDELIWPELSMGKTEYYKHKEKAMLRIAFALRIEVYEDAGEVLVA